jgi:hypothetical protein
MFLIFGSILVVNSLSYCTHIVEEKENLIELGVENGVEDILRETMQIRFTEISKS